MIIINELLTVNRYSRPGTALKAVRGVVIHWVANPQSAARANRNYFESLKDQPAEAANKRYASAHYVIGIDGEIIRCVPDTEVCYHVGANRYTPEALRRLTGVPNNYTIGIELCHPAWDGSFTAATLASCENLAACLLVKHGLGKGDLWRHYDVTEKICPKYFVEREDAWEAFKARFV